MDIKKILKLVLGVVLFEVTCIIYTTVGYYSYNTMTFVVLGFIPFMFIFAAFNDAYVAWKDRKNGKLISRKIRDAIKTDFPKVLIARTKHESSQYEGIEIIDIARWLSDSQI